MYPIRIHFSYKHVDQPWGGANNFIRALRSELSKSKGFQFANSIKDECDIMLMNQLGTGPGGNGRNVPLKLVRRLTGRSYIEFKGRDERIRKLVVRAVNLNWHAHKRGLRNFLWGQWCDRQTLALLNMADTVIFQSAYQREFFVKAGYRGKNENVVIHNGADKSFLCERPRYPKLGKRLRVISSTASPRKTKRHELIAQLSMLKDVDVRHLGAWPKDVDVAQVQLLGMQPREKMVEEMSNSHYFLHTATRDPCPNAIFEAICMGLPVIYSSGTGSSAEIVGENGMPLDESDLNYTIEQARAQLAELRAVVLENRSNYVIGCAAQRYKQVFENLVST